MSIKYLGLYPAAAAFALLCSHSPTFAIEPLSGPLTSCPDAKGTEAKKMFKIVRVSPDRIEEKGGFKVAGVNAPLAAHEQQSFALIPKAWARLMAETPSVKSRDGVQTYAVCFTNGKVNGAFNFMPAVAVSSFENLPPDFTGLTLAHQKYAVFTYQGPASGIGNARYTLTRRFWPKSTYQRVNAPNLEVYAPDYDPTLPNSKMEIWVAISEKK